MAALEMARLVPEKMIAFGGAGLISMSAAAWIGTEMGAAARREAKHAQRAMDAARAAPNPLSFGLVLCRTTFAFWQRAMAQSMAIGQSALQAQHDSVTPVARAANRNRKRLSQRA